MSPETLVVDFLPMARALCPYKEARMGLGETEEEVRSRARAEREAACKRKFIRSMESEGRACLGFTLPPFPEGGDMPGYPAQNVQSANKFELLSQ